MEREEFLKRVEKQLNGETWPFFIKNSHVSPFNCFSTLFKFCILLRLMDRGYG